MLFEPDFLRKLEQLTIFSKKVFVGQIKGERRSTKYGYSVEFADYKNYSIGDDFRYIDWNVFGRLEKLFVKLFKEEEDLHIYIMLDISKSMSFGNPSKFEYAKKVSAALAYIALSNLDRVGIATFSKKVVDILPLTRGKNQTLRIFDFLDKINIASETNLMDACKDYSARIKRAGLAIIISDFFDSNGYEMALKQFLYHKFDVFALHIICDEEMNPKLSGDLKLEDIETGNVKDITISERILKEYQRRFKNFCDNLENFCTKRGINYIKTTTSIPFDEFILKYLRLRDMVK